MRVYSVMSWNDRCVAQDMIWGGATTEFAGPNNLATNPLSDGAVYYP